MEDFFYSERLDHIDIDHTLNCIRPFPQGNPGNIHKKITQKMKDFTLYYCSRRKHPKPYKTSTIYDCLSHYSLLVKVLDPVDQEMVDRALQC